MSWKSKVAAQLKEEHDAGASWRDLGRKYGENQGLLWMIANGKRSPKRTLARKMGIEFRKRYVVAFHCDTPLQQKRLQKIFEPHGARSELRDKLIAGTVRLTEDGEEEPERVLGNPILRWD